MKYDATLKLKVSCANDQAAQRAVAELKKLFANPIVKATLIGYGVTLLEEPDVKVERRKT